MNMKDARVLAFALVGLGCAVYAGSVSAESRIGALQTEMQKACVELGGRFEQSWKYNDQGMQWGRVLSCSTSMGTVTCQDRICQSIQSTRPDSVAGTGRWTDPSDSASTFPINSADFASALAALAEN